VGIALSGRQERRCAYVGTEARARVGLAVLLAFTLWTFAEVFRGGEYPGPTLLGMFLAGGIAVATRRLGRGAALSFLISAVALLWYVCLVFAASATFYGIPTGATLSRLIHYVTVAAQMSSSDVAPAPVRPGYVLMVVVGMWAAAAIGETAAFRWQRPVLAALPCLALFSLVLIVGTGTAAPVLVAAFIAILLTFWGLESSNRLRSWGRWLPTWPGHPEEPPPQITGSLSRKMAAWCVAGVFITPVIFPLGHGLIDWRSGGSGKGGGKGTGGVTTVNPLVSIAPHLLNQTNQELMRVRSNTASYWRLETLAAFDGTNWSPASNPTQPVTASQTPVTIHLSRAPITNTQRVSQTFTLTHLTTPFLPAAVNPTSISFEPGSTPGELLSDPATGDIEIHDASTPGFTYHVTSEVPEVSYETLQTDAVGDPGAIYLQVPPKLSHSVIALARRWTSRAITPLDQLLAIQRHLRRFRYSVTVKAPATSDYLTDFLTRIKAGYCQQFATAFTILARIEGFPTRIAVGFLPGVQSAGPHTFIVRGSDAHAWPEVYFKNAGWLRFEPTPRLAAAVPAYTRVPVSATTVGGGGGPTGRAGRAGGGVGSRGRPRADLLATNGFTGGAEAPGQAHHSGRPQWEKAFSRFGRTLIVVALLALVAIPLLKAARTALRYRRARGALDVAEAAFAHFEDEAAELAEARAPSESAGAYIGRLLASRRLSAKGALTLARIYERAEYSSAGIQEPEAEEARRLVRQLRADLWTRATWWDRAERLFSPKVLARRP
jgi:transglutaminase-like putative cysteine protease